MLFILGSSWAAIVLHSFEFSEVRAWRIVSLSVVNDLTFGTAKLGSWSSSEAGQKLTVGIRH